MAKYIIKESELRSAIKKVIAEELAATVEEGIARSIGNALKNTAKTAVKGAIAPSILAQDIIKKTADITDGKDTITGTISNFFGGSSGSSGSKSQSMSRRERKAKAQRDRLSAGKSVSGEYGKPETYPGIGRRTKLAGKSEMTLPQNSSINWGSFGRHYHDEGDRMWFRKVLDTENSIARVCRGDAAKMDRLQRRYKRRLVDWLKERDMEYENYIKSIN
jgi:hypothetical protein